MYAQLGERGVAFAEAQQSITAVAASAEQAELLGVARRAPLLKVTRLALDPEGKPLEYSLDTYRADAFAITIHNRAALARARASAWRWSASAQRPVGASGGRRHAPALLLASGPAAAGSASSSSRISGALPNESVIPKPELTSTTRTPGSGAVTRKWPGVADG